MSDYPTAVAQLYALGHELHGATPRKFDLAHMRALCTEIGAPQTQFPSVLIAGTNGKGSTAATLASILKAAGQKTALYSSPHLVRVNERIRVNGIAIPDDDFVRCFDRVRNASEKLVGNGTLPHIPSFFETVTAMAFLYFAEQKVNIAVLEVGMGGRLDATNIVEPIVSIITDIDLDHQKYLGDTIGAIAGEKAGILRPDVTAITLPQHREANDVIGQRMIEIGARAVSATRNMAPTSPGSGELVQQSGGRTRFRLSVLGEEVEIDSPLVGRHQLRNLALAITAAEELATKGVPIDAAVIAKGVRETSWPGRFQVLPATPGRAEIVFDVAHNPAGAWALRSALNDRYEDRPRLFVFGAMRDKAIREMAQILFVTADHVYAVSTTQNPRAASPEEVADFARQVQAETTTCASVRDAVAQALVRANDLRAQGKDPVVVITGSVYIVGEGMQLLGVNA